MARFIKVEGQDALWLNDFSVEVREKLRSHLGGSEMWISNPEEFNVPEWFLRRLSGDEVIGTETDNILLMDGLRLAVIIFDQHGSPQVCVAGPSREALEIIIPEDEE